MFGDIPLEHEYHNLGNNCYRLGQYDKAISHYTKAIELNGGMVETYFNRALAYARLGRYDAALDDATHVITENRALHEGYYLRGRIREFLLDDSAAIRDYEKAIELNASFQTAAEQIRLVRSRDWLFRELRDLRERIAFEPSNAYLHYQFGQHLAAVGHHDDALRSLELARTNGFALPDLWVELGQVYVALGKTVQALAAFRQAIHANPTEVAAHAHLGQLLTEAGRYREAAATLREALALPNGDTASLQCGLGMALLGLRHWAEAETSFQYAIKSGSRTAEGAHGLALSAWRQDDPETAWTRCQEALGHTNDMLPALQLSALILFRQGDAIGASELILNTFQANREDGRTAYLLWTLASYCGNRDGFTGEEIAAARLWSQHEEIVASARRLVIERIVTHRHLTAVQRDMPAELIDACPLAAEAGEALYRQLTGSPGSSLRTLHGDLAQSNIIRPVDRLARAASHARENGDAWLSEMLRAYVSVLSSTPEAPQLGAMLRSLNRLSDLGIEHADALLELYRICFDGTRADSMDDMLRLRPRISDLADETDDEQFLTPEVGAVLASVAVWLEQVDESHHDETSDEWAEITELGLELRSHVSEVIAPPEQWAIIAMLTNFGMIVRQHIPTV